MQIKKCQPNIIINLLSDTTLTKRAFHELISDCLHPCLLALNFIMKHSVLEELFDEVQILQHHYYWNFLAQYVVIDCVGFKRLGSPCECYKQVQYEQMKPGLNEIENIREHE